MAAPITQLNSRSAQDQGQGNQPASEQAPTIYQRLLAVANDLPVIQKAGFNKDQNYKYIEASAIAAHLRELFAKHGVYLKTELASADFSEFSSRNGAKGEKVIAWFNFSFINCFDSGDLIKFEPWPAVAMDYSDKALGKAMTAAQKTFLMKQFLVSDIDPDGDSPEAVSNNQNQQAKQQPAQTSQQPSPPTAQPQPQPAAKPAQKQPEQKNKVQPTQALGEPLKLQQLPDLTANEFGYWLNEMKIQEKTLAETLSGGDQKTLKGWAEAYKSKNPDAAIKNWRRFTLYEYVRGLMKHKPEAGWLWDEENQVPRQLEDVPFEEDVPDEGLPL